MRRRRHDPNGLTLNLDSNFGANHAKFCASRNDLRQQGCWKAQKIDHLTVPSACSRIHHLGGSCVRVLTDGLASKKEVDQVRNQQQLPRVRGNSFLCMGVELEQRIEAHELNAAAVENLFARDARKDLLHHPLGSFVPVANWKFEKFAFSVNQSIINAPAIDSEALDWPSELARPFVCHPDACFDLLENFRQIPAKVILYLDRRILKPSHLFKQQLAARHSGEEHSSAFRAQIDSDVE